MKRIKRGLLLLLAVSMMLSLVACGGAQIANQSGGSQAAEASTAEEWVPTKDIEFVIPFAAGGGNDIMVRKIIDIIQRNKLCPVNVVPVSKPGGSGVVGYTYLSSKGKGYEYALASTSASFYTQPLTGNSPFTPDEKSFSFVAHLCKDPVVLTSVASLGFKSLDDIVAYAKAHPGELKYAGTGIASDDAIIMAMLNDLYDINLVYVPYDSAGEMLTALLGGQVELAVLTPAESIEHMKSGTLTPHAASADERLSLLPDVPTFLELGVDMNHQQSRGIVMNPDLDENVQAYYSDLFKRVSETEDWKQFINSNNMTNSFMDYKQYAEFSNGLKEKYTTYLSLVKK